MEVSHPRRIGSLAIAGGGIGLALAPFMVAIKYMTGWAIIPEPFWVPAVQGWLSASFPGTTPAALWTGFGTVYSIALASMLAGLLGMAPALTRGTIGQRTGYWLIIGGLALVVPGDAIHSWTWHQNGLTIPTPGTNPIANTAYAAHMMGMNLVMAGSLLLGVMSLRRRTLVPWVAWLLALVFPAAVLASLSLLPTTPSGALWLFSVLVSLLGVCVARGRTFHLRAA